MLHKNNIDNLKIAVDVGPLNSGDSVRGIGVYTRELLGALNRKGVDVFNSNLGEYDLVHFTRFNPFRISVPYKKPLGTKFILTIYDLIPLIYKRRYPSGFRGRINWEINKYLIRNNIDLIITISRTSKKDICRFIGISPSKVFLTYLAPRSCFKVLKDRSWEKNIREKYNLPDNFALYVGDINYNKNIPLLVDACKIAGSNLVVCGKQAAELPNMDLSHPELRHLKKINWTGVLKLGFVPDEDLVKIYNLATLYIQPSLYEGFGLPVLEAQAAGVPVVASKTQALVEIAENSALFADPKNVNDFAEKIKSVTDNAKLRHELIEKGLENASKYTWKKTAEKTLRIYGQ